ncbi:uncharacterized protein [Rutidosis leptorrhynchoides]|uniref:uncharacterized protein n=1 Tax=Rutidosis leptorrhynchoides TaxID=125765 RepID=UPI003A9A3F32
MNTNYLTLISGFSLPNLIHPGVGESPLANIISGGIITEAGFTMSAKVCDMVSCFGQSWPASWLHKYAALQHIDFPTLSDVPNLLGRVDVHYNVNGCSVSIVWDTIRPIMLNIPWFKVVWFPQCISRHAFLLWLLVGERLKTHDRLKPWELRSNPVLICALCKQCMDSHDHLFFECAYSSNVWDKVLDKVRIPIGSYKWKSILVYMSQFAGRNSARCIVAKLCFAATVYVIWQERNYRIFRRVHRTPDQVFEVIVSNIRLKLMTIKFKPSSYVERLKVDWQLV